MFLLILNLSTIQGANLSLQILKYVSKTLIHNEIRPQHPKLRYTTVLNNKSIEGCAHVLCYINLPIWMTNFGKREVWNSSRQQFMA